MLNRILRKIFGCVEQKPRAEHSFDFRFTNEHSMNRSYNKLSEFFSSNANKFTYKIYAESHSHDPFGHNRYFYITGTYSCNDKDLRILFNVDEGDFVTVKCVYDDGSIAHPGSKTRREIKLLTFTDNSTIGATIMKKPHDDA